MTPERAAGESHADEQAGEQAKRSKATRTKASKALPTDRIAFAKQLEILRAYGQLGSSGRSVTNAEVGRTVGVHPNTASLANAFFTDVGLLQRAADGQVPSPEVIAFSRAHLWKDERALSKLAPLLSNAWFATALLPKIQFRPHTRGEALTVLAEAAGASPAHRGQVETLLDYLRAARLVHLDGDTVRSAAPGAPDETHASPGGAPPRIDRVPPAVDADPTPSAPGAGDPPGQISFHLSLSMTAADIMSLSPDRISAFFAGVAEVMRVRAEIEAARRRTGVE